MAKLKEYTCVLVETDDEGITMLDLYHGYTSVCAQKVRQTFIESRLV